MQQKSQATKGHSCLLRHCTRVYFHFRFLHKASHTSGSHAQFNHRMLAILKRLNYDIYLLAFYDRAHADVKFDIEPKRFAVVQRKFSMNKVNK